MADVRTKNETEKYTRYGKRNKKNKEEEEEEEEERDDKKKAGKISKKKRIRASEEILCLQFKVYFTTVRIAFFRLL